MTVEDLLIHFRYGPDDDDRNQRQYYMPGDEMSGVVSLHLNGPLLVAGISVHLSGVANVSWEATHKKKTYTATEIHLDAGKTLLDTGYDKKVSLPSGIHHFGFSYQLPSHLPSSFNGVYGSVTYTAKATVECEDERSTTVTNEPFLVLRRYELPPEMYQPVTLKTSKFHLGFNAGKIVAECTIDKAAAIPGDDLSIDADVCNWSGRKISLIQAAIVQESRFLAQGRELVFRKYLNTRDDHFDTGLLRGRRWHDIKLLVPPYLADSGLEKCKIMKVGYLFQFKVQVEKKNDILLETPLYVGRHSEQMAQSGKDLLLGRMWQGITSLPEESPKQIYPYLEDYNRGPMAVSQYDPYDPYYYPA